MNTKTMQGIVIGTAMAGGYFGGGIYINNEPRGIIVSPKLEGEFANMRWHKNLNGIEGALSYSDGLANTIAMAEAGSPLAEKMLKLRIGGFDDWHLMARTQALIIQGELCVLPEFKPGTENGFERDYYWTSTRHAEGSDYAWYQNFGNGGQNDDRHGSQLFARAVRTIAL